jgi:hypothetical protein
MTYTPEQVYENGRALYEATVDKKTPGWPLFHSLTEHERAYWVAKAALEQQELEQLNSEVGSQRVAPAEDFRSKELRKPEATELREMEQVRKERDELLAAAKNFRDVRGRHHTEIAANKLFDVLDAAIERSKREG